MLILFIFYVIIGIVILEIYNINKGLNTDIYSVKDIPMYLATLLLWPVVLVITIILVLKSLIRQLIEKIADNIV